MTGLFLACLGCESRDHSLNYFLEHPAILEKTLHSCLPSAASANELSAECKAAIDAQSVLRTYLEAMQLNPELFGQRILDAEMLSAQLEEQLDAAKRELSALEAKKASADALQTARANVERASKAYADKLQEVKMLLIIAGFSSPE